MGIEVLFLLAIVVVAAVAAFLLFGAGAVQRMGKGTEGVVQDAGDRRAADPRPLEEE